MCAQHKMTLNTNETARRREKSKSINLRNGHLFSPRPSTVVVLIAFLRSDLLLPRLCCSVSHLDAEEISQFYEFVIPMLHTLGHNSSVKGIYGKSFCMFDCARLLLARFEARQHVDKHLGNIVVG